MHLERETSVPQDFPCCHMVLAKCLSPGTARIHTDKKERGGSPAGQQAWPAAGTRRWKAHVFCQVIPIASQSPGSLTLALAPNQTNWCQFEGWLIWASCCVFTVSSWQEFKGKERKKNSNSKLIRFLTAFWGLSPRESRAGPAPEHQSEERGEPSQLEPVR